jgi:hypothetical protein
VSGSTPKVEGGPPELAAATAGESGARWMETEAGRRRGRRAPSPSTPSFDRGRYSDSALARARRLWTVRAAAEHESALIFAGLLPFALEAGADLDTQTVILGMAEDEIRHAAICAEVARCLGGAPATPPALAIPRSARPVAVQLLNHVIYGNCMTETVNVARLVDASENARDPYMQQALHGLLSDEVRHARFGFALLADWARWLAGHPDARQATEQSLPQAFAALERTLSGVGAARDDFGADDLALGSPDPARLAEVFYRTVEEAVVPGLERAGFAAGAAWQARTAGR